MRGEDTKSAPRKQRSQYLSVRPDQSRLIHLSGRRCSPNQPFLEDATIGPLRLSSTANPERPWMLGSPFFRSSVGPFGLRPPLQRSSATRTHFLSPRKAEERCLAPQLADRAIECSRKILAGLQVASMDPDE